MEVIVAIRNVSLAPIVRELEKNNLLPAIVFRTARVQCDTDVEKAAANRKLQIPSSRQTELRQAVESIAKRYDTDIDLIRSHPHYSSLVKTAIGAHHAGQLLTWRLVLEELMSAGLLRVLVATGTVAAGVDFPARTVVVTAHSRRGSEGYENLTSAELQQMSGRAGRRGKDTVGFCLVAPSMFCDGRVVSETARKPPAPLESAYFPSASTVLNLMRYRNVDDLRYTVDRSLASFSDRKQAVIVREESEHLASGIDECGLPADQVKKRRKKVSRMERKASELESRQMDTLERALSGLGDLGYLDGSSLSEKGYWAAQLCTSMVIELGEMIQEGLFDGCGGEEMAVMIGSVSGDSYRRYLSVSSNLIAQEKVNLLKEIVTRVRSAQLPGTSDSREYVEDCASTISTWLKAEDWQEFRGLLNLAGVAEGDAARLISQTADHLNQLSRLSESHPELAKEAFYGKMKLLRPPISEALALVSE